MTFEEFLVLPGEGKREFVAGTVVDVEPSNFDHDVTRVFVERTIGAYTSFEDLGEVNGESYVQKLRPDLGRAPDVAFFRKDNAGQVKRTYFDGAADLCVEIISPSSRRTDLKDKYREYEDAGVTEYWIIDPDRREAEFHLLDEEGRYREVLPDAEGKVYSTVIDGFFIRVEWLWTRPNHREILRELGLI